MKRLENKIAVVTGAAKGIGRAIAMRLAREGASVIINYNGSKEKAQETVAAIEEAGGHAEAMCFNVADPDASKEACDAIVKKYGRVDILVNNAGINRDGLFMAMKEDDFSAVIDVNLKGTFHMTKNLARNFIRQKGGRVINIASVAGVIGNAGQANYAASKAGIIGFTKSVARELAGKGVCVNAIAPGFINTDMVAKMPEAAVQKGIEAIPMKKIGQPEDIAALAAFLASDDAAYITGQVICVDGGMAM